MDKRRTDTKEKMFQATEKAISLVDYTKLSLRNLANECGVSVTSTYKHFANKDDLLGQVHRRLAKKKLEEYRKSERNLSMLDYKAKVLSLAFYLLNEFKEDPRTMNFIFFSPFAENSYGNQGPLLDESQNLLEEYTKYISGLKEQYHLIETEESLFIRMWSFLQGYSLLVSKGVVQLDKQIIEHTLDDFIGER